MAALIFSLLQQFLVECGPLITYHSQPWTSHRSTPAGTRGGLSGAAPTTRSTPSAPGIPTAPRPTSLCSHQGPKQGEKTAEWMGEEKTAMRPQERCSHPITAGSFQQTRAGKGYTASLLEPAAHSMYEGCSGLHSTLQLLCHLQMGTDAPQ